MWKLTVTLVALVAVLSLPGSAHAAGKERHASGATPREINAPVAPDVIARSGSNIVVRATRIPEPIVIDGHLDEDVYTSVKSFGDFVQQEPHEGQPSTVATQVWVFFDDRAIYVSARLSQDASIPIVGSDVRRDAPNQFDNDNFAVIFDTFLDRRNGFMFQTNPQGSLTDQLATDEGAGINRDWNTVWDLRTSRDANGWSVEMWIPFKSLRFPSGREQTWGINFRRNIQGRTEFTYLTHIPASAGRRGLARLSLAATLVGLEANTRPSRLEVKPYAIGSATSEHGAATLDTSDASMQGGVDMKAAIGSGFTGDLTVHTDFAQVEEDEAQVNLTRFSLFQAEKREFFLEGLGMFAFGGVPNLKTQGQGNNPPIAPVMFFSRRIGLADDDPVQIVAGGRVTGRSGPWSMGALQVRQEASASTGLPETDFTVVRARRNMFKRGSVGMIYTRRSHAEVGGSVNQVGGIDLLLAPSQDLTFNAYAATSDTPGSGSDNKSYRARLDYTADRAGLAAEYLVVGDDFKPDVGLMRREDFRRAYLEGRISRRPKGTAWLRRWSVTGTLDYITDNDDTPETRMQSGAMKLELTNGDEATVTYERSYESLADALDVSKVHAVPAGAYHFGTLKSEYQLGTRHRVAGDVGFSIGSFYGGTIQEATAKVRSSVGDRLMFEPNIAVNRVDLPQVAAKAFWVNAFGVRSTWSFSPRASVSSLVQIRNDNDSTSASVRFRWEYRPGSDLFFVYSQGREGLDASSRRNDRSVALKVTRLLRF